MRGTSNNSSQFDRAHTQQLASKTVGFKPSVPCLVLRHLLIPRATGINSIVPGDMFAVLNSVPPTVFMVLSMGYSRDALRRPVDNIADMILPSPEFKGSPCMRHARDEIPASKSYSKLRSKS